MNLNTDLLIQFWDIDFIWLLDSQGLDCFALLSQGLAMTGFLFFWIASANLRFASQ